MHSPLLILMLSLAAVELMAQTTTIVNSTKSYGSVPPTWLTSPYFRAGNQAVISSLTGNSETPTYTFTFSSPLTATPELAYGIKNYRGNDYLGQQFYQIKRIGLNHSTFTVSIQIYGVTNIWLLNVAYLAVEPSFPHHFNTFENVPLNYSSGNIVNISSKNTNTETYFTEYINYTSQAAGKTHNTFTYPLASNTIVLFMTSLWIKGTFGQPVKFHISSQIVSSQYYMLNATLEINVQITNVHFSQVIFNKDDIVSSKKYQVVYQEWTNNMNGGWIDIPQEFVDNFIMGVTSFQTSDAACGFEYQWEFTNSTGVFGVQLLRSWTLTNTCGFSWSQTSILYIQTWLCNSPYVYYNITTQMCQSLCGGYHIENETSVKCEPCTNFMCYQCDSVNQSICLDCASYDYMELVNDTCACITGYFYLQGKCITCALSNPGCLSCTYGILSQTLAFNSSEFICSDCNQTQNYFNVNGSCVACPLSNCVNCSSLAQCSQCSSGYSIHPIFFNCSYCLVFGCLECLPNSNAACKVCYNAIGYHLDNSTNQCINKCGDGLTVTGLEPCDDGNTFDGDGCSSTCQFQPHFNCTLLVNLTTVCTGICGDGYLYGRQEGCDDGNTNNADGCSSDCKLELKITLIRQQRAMALCNHLQFWFQVSPYSSFVDTLDFASTIVMNSTALINPSFSYSKPTLSLSYDFTEDMTLRTVQIYQNSTMMLMHPNYNFYIASPNVTIKPNNNIAANFLDQKQCEDKQFYGKAFKILQVASFFTLFVSMIPGKIIGLQLFGVLQLAYFSVGSIDAVNVLLYPLMSMKQLNGYSTPVVGSSSDNLPQRVQSIEYYSSFLDNFNVMFLLLLVEFTIGAILYFTNKLLNNNNSKMGNTANRLLKQFFLTLLLFNCFNIAYAAGVYFNFSNERYQTLSFGLAVVSLFALVAMAVAFLFVDPSGFGEFKEKFKKDAVSSAYMSISIVYRSIVGFLLAYSNDDDLSTLFSLGCALMFLIYNLVNLPFAKAYHNYRACLCHFAQFITIFVAMYYRSMKSTTAPSEVAVIFSPAKLQFAVLFASLLASVIVLAYDSYLFIKEASCCSDQDQTQQKQQTNKLTLNYFGNQIIQKGNKDKSGANMNEITKTEEQMDQAISYVVFTPK